MIQVSQAGGRDPIWSRTGQSLIYTNNQADLWEAELPFRGGDIVSRKLADGPLAGSALIPPQQIEVVVNWFDELKQLAPVP